MTPRFTATFAVTGVALLGGVTESQLPPLLVLADKDTFSAAAPVWPKTNRDCAAGLAPPNVALKLIAVWLNPMSAEGTTFKESGMVRGLLFAPPVAVTVIVPV